MAGVSEVPVPELTKTRNFISCISNPQIKCKVIRKIGRGTFSSVFLAVDTGTKCELALKIERTDSRHQLLSKENRIYEALRDLRNKYIPMKWFYGILDGQYNILAITRLGHNLGELFQMCGRRFSIKTTMTLASQILPIVKAIHAKHYVIHDIKPENFLMGLKSQANKVFMVDLALLTFYCKGPPPKDDKKHGMRGTARFVSINSHKGSKPSPRDDIEAFLYMLIFFVKGTLPWQKYEDMEITYNEMLRKILEKKLSTSSQDLCEGLPSEFADMLSEVRAMTPDTAPSYSKMQTIFERILKEVRKKDDPTYDWSALPPQSPERYNLLDVAEKIIDFPK